MSSVGQVAGGIVGAVAGFMLPGVGWAIGAQVGMMVGGYIDPPKGPHSEGPKLSDLTVQTSTYGAPKTRAYGTVPVTGNVFWLEGNRYVEHAIDHESGGKGGGGGATYTEYTYSATFAVSLTEGQEITGIRRLWLGDRLIYDAGSDNVESIIASNLGGDGFLNSSAFNDVTNWWLNAIASGRNWVLYRGTDDQQPDPRMQADVGVANCPSYPGRAYIVFYDQDLTEHYNNTLLAAQVKAEVVCSGPDTIVNHIDSTPVIQTSPVAGNSLYPRYISTAIIGPSSIVTAVARIYDNTTYFHVRGMETFVNELAVSNTWTGFVDDAVSGEDGRQLVVAQSDRPIVISWKGYLLSNQRRIDIYEEGQMANVGQWHLITESPAGIALVDGGVFYTVPTGSNGPITQFAGTEPVYQSTQQYNCITAGYSENYLFVVDYNWSNSTNCRIYKVERTGLSIVQTVNVPVDGRYAAISVASDSLFYIAADHYVYKVDGSTVSSLGEVFPNVNQGPGSYCWFKVFSEVPPYAIMVKQNTADTHDVSDVTIASLQVNANSAYLPDIIEAECGRAGISASELDLTEVPAYAVRGYRVSGVRSPRAALEPLQAAWPFDVFQKGYKIGVKMRGSASVATISQDELGAAGAGDSSRVLLPIAREMETQIPLTVTVKYLDASRDYEIGEQTAPERPGVASVEPRTVDLPIVLSDDEAAQVADVLNAKEWVERVKLGPFSLPPTYAHLQPADVVTINHRSRSWEARLIRVEYLPDGRLTCEAVRTASAAYDSSVTGAVPLALGQSLVPLTGSTTALLLDIPMIVSDQNTPGVVYGLYGRASGWPGAVLMRSDDGGLNYANAGSLTSNVQVFDAGAALATGSPYSLDLTGRLIVTPRIATHTLYSLTNAEFFAGRNTAAYGAPGRWECINFKTAVDNGDGSFTIRDFRRGMFGTEQHMGSHQTGDVLVMLESSTGFSPLSISALGAERLFKPVTIGKSVDSAAAQSFTYAGVNLMPLNPVMINGKRNPLTFEWTVTWSPRSREWVELFSGYSVPVGETSEAYEVEIWTSGYATLKRTVTGLTSASLSYTSADQLADFGDNQGTLYLKIYQVSSSVGRGYPLAVSINRYAHPDPYINQVTCLMHMDTTGLTDTIGNTVTLVGNAARSATQSKFGGYAAVFDGTGDYLQLTASNKYDFGTGDFTVEAWVYIAANSSQDAWPERTAMIFSVGKADGTGTQFTFAIQGSSTTTGTGLNVSAGAGVYVGSATVSQLAWHHVAVCRASGTTYLLLDGNRIYSTAAFNGVAMGGSANPAYIGGRPYGALNYYQYLNGYIDDVRVTKAARYTGTTYTVPTAAHPNP